MSVASKLLTMEIIVFESFWSIQIFILSYSDAVVELYNSLDEVKWKNVENVEEKYNGAKFSDIDNISVTLIWISLWFRVDTVLCFKLTTNMLNEVENSKLSILKVRACWQNA